MSDTPRTDAIGIDHLTASEATYNLLSLARKLQGELEAVREMHRTACQNSDEAQAELNDLRARLEQQTDDIAEYSGSLSKAEQDHAAARADSERLRKLFIRAALMAEQYFDPGPIPPPEPTDADWEIADIIYARETEQAIDAARNHSPADQSKPQ